MEFRNRIYENNACSKIIFFMPWKTAADETSKIQAIKQETLEIANELNAPISPAGTIWGKLEVVCLYG